VLLVVLVNLGHALQMQFPLWIALVAVGALAVLRGWGRPALAATAIAALAVARPLLPQVGLPWWLPGYGDWSAVGRYLWPAVILAVLAWPGVARLRPRSWWWLLLPAAQAALPLTAGPWSLVKAGAEMGLLLAVLVVAVGALDPRPAIAAAVYLVPGLLYGAESIAEGASSTLAWATGWCWPCSRRPSPRRPGESGDSNSPSTNLPPTPRQAGKPVRRTGHAVDRCRVDST
jgi:hypothetical protein